MEILFGDTMLNHTFYDVIIIGAGVSGSFIAQELAQAGLKILILEAGKAFTRTTYPRKEIDSNSLLYWGGGIELNSSASLGLLRPKVVGGGSVMNQALMDRFSEDAFESWKSKSGVNFFTTEKIAPWYDKAETELVIQEVPSQYGNENANIFKVGFKANGFQCAPLKRAQSNCHYEDGNDCIECLSGCRVDSKQSMPVTTLKKALKSGAHLISEFEVKRLSTSNKESEVKGIWKDGKLYSFKAKKMVLASGAIGNSALLLNNGFQKSIPAIGKNFYTHPQFMMMALYDKKINAHKGAFQSYKSNDLSFRKQGFKLENVFAPPVAIAMLIKGYAEKHYEVMQKYDHMACIEVAIRDTHPGTISVSKSGRPIVKKELNKEDKARKARGIKVIHDIFHSTGARQIIPGEIGIGLHLMGGCSIGTNEKKSVISPNFSLHHHPNIYCADSSIFPDAPGINPSLTIMALSKMAANEMIKGGM